MDDNSNNKKMVTLVKKKFPKLFVTEIIDNNLKFGPELDDGFIEYKRTLVDCSEIKVAKYATQMRWRIMENIRNHSATYFIGIDDNGSIIGLSNEEIIDCIVCFVSIAASINASITCIQITHVNDLTIIKIIVKIKKIKDNYLVEFGEKI